jgi:hypothetical protein
MNPIRWPENPVEQRIEKSLIGAAWKGSDFAGIENALSRLQTNPQVRELMLTYLGGKPAYIAFENPSETAILWEPSSMQALLDQQTLKSTVGDAARPYSIVESRLVTRYESYYFDPKNRLRLPALFLRLSDPEQSILYLDLYTGRVARSYSRWERLDRWLFEGLHDFEIPWLYRHRPLWDIIVILGLSGGVWLSTTGIIIAWRRVRLVRSHSHDERPNVAPVDSEVPLT